MYEYPVDDPESEYCVTDGTSFSRNGISCPVFRASISARSRSRLVMGASASARTAATTTSSAKRASGVSTISTPASGPATVECP